MKNVRSAGKAVSFLLGMTVVLGSTSLSYAKSHTQSTEARFRESMITAPCQTSQDQCGVRVDVCVLAAEGYSKVTTTKEGEIYLGVVLKGELSVPVVVLEAGEKVISREVINVSVDQQYLAIKPQDAHRMTRNHLVQDATKAVSQKRQELLKAVEQGPCLKDRP